MTIEEILQSPTGRWLRIYTILATPVLILADWIAVAKYGTGFLLASATAIYVIGAIIAATWILIGPFAMMLNTQKIKVYFAYWLLSLVFCFLVGLGLNIGAHIRTKAFERLAIRSQPLVEAIHEFEQTEGMPPPALDSLVPSYLVSIPSTGIRAYPEYEYDSGTYAERQGAENWMLWVNSPSGSFNFDRFVYFPQETYPDRGESGSYERIANWAYYHE